MGFWEVERGKPASEMESSCVCCWSAGAVLGGKEGPRRSSSPVEFLAGEIGVREEGCLVPRCP